jgi:hypothetical protein
VDSAAFAAVVGQLFCLERERGRLMKRAPLIFFCALAIFAATVAVSRRDSEVNETRTEKLDIKDIDTLEINVPWNLQLTIDSRAQPSMSYTNDNYLESNKASIFSVRRENNRLVVTTSSDLDAKQFEAGERYGYLNVSMILPKTIRTVVSNCGVELNSTEALEDFEIKSSDRISWSGNVKRLRLIHNSSGNACEDSYSKHIAVNGDKIGELYIELLEGEIDLHQSESIASATLMTGPEVKLMMSSIDTLKNTQIEPIAITEKASTPPAQ